MKLFKRRPFRRFLNNQSGQAVVEYVLILIISVTLLFLARGLFSGLNNFMTSYVGGYFKCLMVQGELPTLGVADRDLNKHPTAGYKCQVDYQPSTIASGGDGGTRNVGTTKPLTTAKGSTKETASRRTGANKSNLNSKDRKAANELDSSSSSSSFSDNLNNRSEAYNSADSDSYDDSIQSVSMSQNNRSNSEKSRTITGQQADDILKNSRGGLKARQNMSRIIPLTDDNRPGPRRNKFNPPPRSIAGVAEEIDEPYSFGYFLKWIVIAGIVIALVVFFGGQVLNYSKSDSN